LGGFDIMPNSAGIAPVQPLANVTSQELEAILKVEIEGVLWGIHAAAEKSRFADTRAKIFEDLSVYLKGNAEFRTDAADYRDIFRL
jgi:meso-butanediol dehydrogenase/(S,S)-butanediol dehydrogenase/diacetyl reductase